MMEEGEPENPVSVFSHRINAQQMESPKRNFQTMAGIYFRQITWYYLCNI